MLRMSEVSDFMKNLSNECKMYEAMIKDTKTGVKNLFTLDEVSKWVFNNLEKIH